MVLEEKNTLESSTFDSEFVAMRIERDLIDALQYTLRIFGVTLDGPTDMLCDNQGGVKNTSFPQLTLGNKYNVVNYHVIQEAAAEVILCIGKEDTETNLADLPTKILGWKLQNQSLPNILYVR